MTSLTKERLTYYRMYALNRKNWKYPYESVECPEYLKDKQELMDKHQNGWWWYSGVDYHRIPKEHRHLKDSGPNKGG